MGGGPRVGYPARGGGIVGGPGGPRGPAPGKPTPGGRAPESIQVNGRDCWTLFDGAARNTYVVRGSVPGIAETRLRKPQPAGLGGRVRQVNSECILQAEIQGHAVSVKARIVDEIGNE